MVKPLLHRYTVTALLLAGMAFALPGASWAQQGAGNGEERISSDEVIERTGRALRVGPDSAETWVEGLAGVDAPRARLEHALLQAIGPLPVRNRQAGLERLREMLDDEIGRGAFDTEAAKTLRVLISLIGANTALAAENERLRAALRDERETHQQTLDKLAALRDIEDQLEARNGDNDNGDNDDENGRKDP